MQNVIQKLTRKEFLIISKVSDIAFAVSLYSGESVKRIGTAFSVLLEKVSTTRFTFCLLLELC